MAGRTRACLKRLEEQANTSEEEADERPAEEPEAEAQEAQALQPDADVRTGRSRSRSVSRSRSRSRSPLAARTPGLRERRPFAGAAVNDWCRYVDQASGKPYWYSKARGYSTWVSQETVVEPAADAAPAGAAARHPQQVNNGNPYQRISATLTAFEKQLAEERAKLPAFRAQNAAIQAASTNPYSAYYQSLAAPATTQGHVPNNLSLYHDAMATQRRILQDAMQRHAQFRQMIDQMQREGVQQAAASRQRQLDFLARLGSNGQGPF